MKVSWMTLGQSLSTPLNLPHRDAAVGKRGGGGEEGEYVHFLVLLIKIIKAIYKIKTKIYIWAVNRQ